MITEFSHSSAQATPERATYHPAIQGLRATAVLSVVLGHALVPGFSGGFVGVDVFFVISGFLIVRLLFTELARDGSVNLVQFWARRVRRLIPNATLTLLVTLIACFLLLPGFMRKDVAMDVVMASLQLANYHFANRAVDYFRLDEPHSPVLHFWSLAVEEQFYIAWPLLIAVVCLLDKKRAYSISRWLLVVIIAVSFAGMLKAISLSQPIAFFHSWARAWQLGLGGILAIAFNAGVGLSSLRSGKNDVLGKVVKVLGWLGFTAILFCVHFYDETMLYPGVLSIVPTLGAVAVIASTALFSRTSGLLNTVLSVWPMQWIGARSYSWYLWHWPFLILAEYAYPTLAGLRVISVFLSLTVASVVYTLVEEPVREGRGLRLPDKRTLLAGLSSILLVAVSAAGFAAWPIDRNFNADLGNARMKEARSDLGQNYADKCHLDVEMTRQPPCEYGVASSQRRAILFGDSHAAQWFAAIQAAANTEGWSFRNWTKSGCPAGDIRVWYNPRRAIYSECDTWRETALAAMINTDRPDVVFVSSKLGYSVWLEEPGKPGRLAHKSEAAATTKLGLARTVQRLSDAGIKVVLIRDTPRMAPSMALCYVRGGGPGCDLSLERAQPKPWIDLQVSVSFQNDPNIHFLDLSSLICKQNVCRVEREGKVVWRDSHHIRSQFAKSMSDPFRVLLRGFDATTMR